MKFNRYMLIETYLTPDPMRIHNQRSRVLFQENTLDTAQTRLSEWCNKMVNDPSCPAANFDLQGNEDGDHFSVNRAGIKLDNGMMLSQIDIVPLQCELTIKGV